MQRYREQPIEVTCTGVSEIEKPTTANIKRQEGNNEQDGASTACSTKDDKIKEVEPGGTSSGAMSYERYYRLSSTPSEQLKYSTHHDVRKPAEERSRHECGR